MLFYRFDILDDFIKSDLTDNLKTEKENIEQLLDLYDNKKANLIAITSNLIEVADCIHDKSKLESFHETISLLKKAFEDINFIQTLTSTLKENLSLTSSLYDKDIANNKDEIKANLVEYNKQKDELFYKIIEFENANTSILNYAVELSLENSNLKKEKQNKILNNIKDKKKTNTKLEPCDCNRLIISEKEQIAYLPYFYAEIESIYKNPNNFYQSLQDVVDNLYIVSLKRFKNSVIARFREGYNLIRNKEKGSITKALDLGLELMFKYELNPVIVAACRNLDELDIYLDCLEENELYDFTCFEIKFEVAPQLVKNKSV